VKEMPTTKINNINRRVKDTKLFKKVDNLKTFESKNQIIKNTIGITA
jgi:hypothetical protein